MRLAAKGSSRTDVENVISISLAALAGYASFPTYKAELELTVGALGLTSVLVPTAGKIYNCTFQNTSAGGQNIRIGLAPTFAAGVIAGQLLKPGATWTVPSISANINAIANAAGALLSVTILESS